MNLYKFHNDPKSVFGFETLKPVLEQQDADLVWREIGRAWEAGKGGLTSLATNSLASYTYARKNKKPFPKGEDAIAKGVYTSYNYATKVLNGPFPKGEKAISTNSEYSLMYSGLALGNKPFPEGEKAIAKNADMSVDYAKVILKGRFPEGEKAIAKDADASVNYAKYILKGRFPEGEDAIFNSDYQKTRYLYFLKIKGIEI